MTATITAAALVCFGANSVLCRLALRDGAIDPATFTTIRVLSGALMLLAITAPRAGVSAAAKGGTWATGVLLALYAVPFAFAYAELSTGTGALILFGSVQVTMFAAAVVARDHPRPLQWVGAAVAFAGLVYLVLPGVTAPTARAAALMVTAGIAWGFYSLRGRGLADPLRHTTGNFVRALPLAAAALLAAPGLLHAAPRGIALAVASGAIASGLGYVAWYAALRTLSSTQAGVVQLGGPVIAGAGGVLLLGEPLTLRLVLAGAMVLGGIMLATVTRRRR